MPAATAIDTIQKLAEGMASICEKICRIFLLIRAYIEISDEMLFYQQKKLHK